MEEIWKEVDTHLGIVYSNLGICCQDYCDASIALHNLEQAMEKLVTIKEKYELHNRI